MSTKVLSQKKTFNVAVVGATGAVGREMIRMLQDRKFPGDKIKLLASAKSEGKSLEFNGSHIPVQGLSKNEIKDLDIAIFSAGATVSKEYAPLFAKARVFVIDNSSAWRMEKDVALVVPEVNPHALD